MPRCPMADSRLRRHRCPGRPRRAGDVLRRAHCSRLGGDRAMDRGSWSQVASTAVRLFARSSPCSSALPVSLVVCRHSGKVRQLILRSSTGGKVTRSMSLAHTFKRSSYSAARSKPARPPKGILFLAGPLATSPAALEIEGGDHRFRLAERQSHGIMNSPRHSPRRAFFAASSWSK